jgi:hypothetical protein
LGRERRPWFPKVFVAPSNARIFQGAADFQRPAIAVLVLTVADQFLNRGQVIDAAVAILTKIGRAYGPLTRRFAFSAPGRKLYDVLVH